MSAAEIRLREGRLHIAREVHAHALRGCEAVALLARDGDWWLLPLHAGAGGLQVKLRNAQGDRVVESQEFFRAQGLEDSPRPVALRLREDAAQGAFVLERVDA
jgi:hypothetical protein